MTLEERITRLEDIEAIRQLQAKYQRCLDTRDFDGLEECFTDDIDAAYDNAHESYKGKENVLSFLYSVMTTDLPSSHLIHGGEIDVTTDNGQRTTDNGWRITDNGQRMADNGWRTAHGKWYLEDFLLHRKFLVKLHGAAIYDVDYRKDDNGWRISKIGYTRCYEYFELRGLLNLLTLGKMTFLDMFKKKPKSERYAGKTGIAAHIHHFTKSNNE